MNPGHVNKPQTRTSVDLYEFRIDEPLIPYETEFTIPQKFQHVDLDKGINRPRQSR